MLRAGDARNWERISQRRLDPGRSAPGKQTKRTIDPIEMARRLSRNEVELESAALVRNQTPQLRSRGVALYECTPSVSGDNLCHRRSPVCNMWQPSREPWYWAMVPKWHARPIVLARPRMKVAKLGKHLRLDGSDAMPLGEKLPYAHESRDFLSHAWCFWIFVMRRGCERLQLVSCMHAALMPDMPSGSDSM